MTEEFYTKDGTSLKDAMDRFERMLNQPDIYGFGKPIEGYLASYDVNAMRTVFAELKVLQKEVEVFRPTMEKYANETWWERRTDNGEIGLTIFRCGSEIGFGMANQALRAAAYYRTKAGQPCKHEIIDESYYCLKCGNAKNQIKD